MEPGRRYASGYGKLCGALDTVGVNGVYNPFFYAQISNEQTSCPEKAKNR
jgi:hypothetical protein